MASGLHPGSGLVSGLIARWGGSSWFGGPNDSTTGSTTASGAPITTPGIAVYDQSTLGGWWLLKAPNGDIGLVKQTDIGPAPWTGRAFDYTYSLLPLFGYSQKSFPTNSQSYGIYVGKSIDGANFGTKLDTAMKSLGASAEQAGMLMQSVDAGAIMQGRSAVVVPAKQKPGTVDTAAGQRHIKSEAVPAGPNINVPNPLKDLGGIWQSIVGDAKYAGLFIAALALGALMIFHGAIGMGGGGGKRTVVVPV